MMGRSRRKGREVNGFLLLDKPPGVSSNSALQRVRRLFNAQKAGHTGSLDPMATGMLPICFGHATKIARYSLVANKRYAVTVRLGEATDTGDGDGQVTDSRAVPALDGPQLQAALAGFLGVTQQIPPMYSALKHEGTRLYHLARRGETITRPPRDIEVFEIELNDLRLPEFSYTVSCSKGTYVRVLSEDIAGALGTVGHVSALRRVSVEPWSDGRLWQMDELEQLADRAEAELDAALLPLDSALGHWPAVELDDAAVARLGLGQPVEVGGLSGGWYRVYSGVGECVALAEQVPNDGLQPRRVFL